MEVNFLVFLGMFLVVLEVVLAQGGEIIRSEGEGGSGGPCYSKGMALLDALGLSLALQPSSYLHLCLSRLLLRTMDSRLGIAPGGRQPPLKARFPRCLAFLCILAPAFQLGFGLGLEKRFVERVC